MKKGGTWVLIIVLVIIVGIAIGLSTSKPQDNYNANEEQKNSITNTVQNEEIQNNTQQNNVENENNENNQNIENSEVQNTVTSSETFDDDPKTEEQRAIEIVKKDWNNKMDNVKFSTEGMDENSRYVISVRDVNTTEALAFYTVNVKDGTFTKREMF